MTLATKNNAIIVKDGKLADGCGCCCPKYAKFEWVDEPPPSQSGQTIDGKTDVGFCSCYWKDGVPLLQDRLATGCSFKGGINRGGLRNSRGYRFQFGQAEIGFSPIKRGDSGTESGLSANFYDAPTGFGQQTQLAFDCSKGQCSFLLVGDAELRIQLNYFSQNTILVGLHAAGSSETIVEGATIPNAITGSGSYRYRIVRSTDADVRAINASSLGASLKDCNGAYIAEPSSPWSVAVTADPISVTSLGMGNFSTSVFGPFIPDGILDAWSHTFTANTLESAQNGQPLLWTFKSQSVGFLQATGTSYGIVLPSQFDLGFRVASALNANVQPYTFGATGDGGPFTNPGGAACGGCQVRFQVSGVLVRTRILVPFTGGLGFVNTLSGMYYQDEIYFDDVLSPCFDNVTQASWEATPTRRRIYFGYWAGGYSYPQVLHATPTAMASVTVQ